MAKIIGSGAKTPSNTWEALKLNANGRLKVAREVDATVINIGEKTSVRDTNAHDIGTVDVAEYNYTSLRVENGLDSAATIYFYDDRNSESTMYLTRPSGAYVAVSVPAQSQTIVTPQDLAELPYMRYVRPIVMCQSAPTSGTIFLQIIAKRNI